MTVYCPYTDKDIPTNETDREHIVPLALGGMDGFEISVSRAANSEIGSRIDGAMARDFFTMTKRDRFDVRGHSGKEPIFIAKNSSDPAGKPLQIGLGQRTGLQVWSPIDKEYIRDARAARVNTSFSIDTILPLRFVAKVALSAGYFAYGEVFRNHVKHQDLRTIMNSQGAETEAPPGIEALVDDRFSTNQSEQFRVFRALCKAAEPHSVVGLVPASNRLRVFVGLLGDYQGMINVPAQTSAFPNEDIFRWGHLIVLKKSGVVRMSFVEALQEFAERYGPRDSSGAANP